MISKDYNHSSVVMYSVGNEITELGLADGQEQARIMTEFCHTKDHTRPVTAGINLMLATMAGSKKSIYGTDEDGKVKDSGSGGLDNAPTSEFFNIMMNKMGGLINKAAKTKKATAIAEIMSGIFDIPGYNYASSRYKIDARNHPEQATTGSETLPQTLYDNWQLVKSIPTMTGDFMWTGYDYLGESGIGTIQYKDKKTKQNADPGLIISGGAGIIDICGKNVRKLDGARSSGDYRKLQQLVLTLIPAQTISSLFLCGVSQMRWKAGHGKAAKGKKLL